MVTGLLHYDAHRLNLHIIEQADRARSETGSADLQIGGSQVRMAVPGSNGGQSQRRDCEVKAAAFNLGATEHADRRRILAESLLDVERVGR